MRLGTARRGAALGAAVLFSVAAAAAQLAVPALTGRVVDTGDMLSPDVEAVLTERLAAHEDSTGNQIAVLTVPSLEGRVLEPYATEVFRSWGLGDAEANNGVLLLIARDDRKIRIEVGYGLEGSIPDALAAQIIRNEMTPRFREGDADGGTLAAVEALIGAAEGRAPEFSDTGDQMPWGVAMLFGLFFGGLPVALGGYSAMLSRVVGRYFAVLFLTPFAFVGSSMALMGIGLLAQAHPWTAIITYPVGAVIVVCGILFPVTFLVLDIVLSRTEWWQEKRRHHEKKQEAFKRARRSGKKSVVVDGVSYTVPTSSSGGGGGGGFSGGGGSSGGGGASGGW